VLLSPGLPAHVSSDLSAGSVDLLLRHPRYVGLVLEPAEQVRERLLLGRVSDRDGSERPELPRRVLEPTSGQVTWQPGAEDARWSCSNS